MRTLYRSALGAALLVALAALAAPVRAAEPDAERDRRARVALALTGKPAGAPAPAPRAVPKDYAAGYKAAAEQSKPLVVFVGCKEPHPAPGAVVARTDALADVTGPAAVVGYPVGDTLFVHTVMACPVEDSALKTAIDGAAKKIDRPAVVPQGDKPAPRPLDWDIRAKPPANCPDCETCPHCGRSLREPPAKPPAAVGPACWDRDGYPLRRTSRGAYERVPGSAPVAVPEPPAVPGHPLAPNCPNGRCPLPR